MKISKNKVQHLLSLVCVLVAGVFLFLPQDVLAANKYWIGVDDGSFSDDSNWSTSSGGANDTTAPGSGDVAIFDGSDTSNVSIDASISVQGIQIDGAGDANGAYTGTLTQETGSTITVGGSGWVQDDGVFAGGDSSIDFNSGGDWTLNGGTFIGTSDTMTIEDSFTINGGTFDGTGMSLTFDGAGSADDSSIGCSGELNSVGNVNPRVVFAKLNSGGVVTIEESCSIYIDVISTAGTVDVYGILSNSSTINAATIIVRDGGLFTQDGDVDLTFHLLVHTGGVFNFGGTNINLEGDFDSSGTVSGLTGVNLTFDGSSSSDDSDITCSGDFNSSDNTNPTVNFSKGNTEGFVTINSGCTVYVTSVNMQGSVTVEGNLDNAGTFAGGVGKVNSGGTWIQEGNLDLNFELQVNIGGTFVFGGTDIFLEGDFIGDGTISDLSSVTITFDGSASSDDSTISYSGPIGSIVIDKSNPGGLTIIDSDLTIVGDITRTDGIISNPIGETTIYLGGDLVIETGDGFAGDKLTIELSGSGGQTLSNPGGVSIEFDIVIDKPSGDVTLDGDFIVSGGADCTISEGIFNLGGNNFTCTGTFTIENGGALSLFGIESVTTPILDPGSTIIYTGDGDAAVDSYLLDHIATTYSNLIVSSTDGATDTFHFNSTLNIDGSFAITAGTVSAGSNDISIAENFTNSGTYTAGTGEVIFDSGATSTISGNTTFYDLTVNTDGKVVQFENGVTISIDTGGTIAIGSGGVEVTLDNISGLTQWNIVNNGSGSYTDVILFDSNLSGNDITLVNVTDAGNNSGYGFNANPTIAGVSGVQVVDSSGHVTITITSIDDPDDDIVQLQFEYSVNDGVDWFDPTLATAATGTLDNGAQYQLADLSTAGGVIDSLTIIWQAATDLAAMTDTTTARIRVTPFDGVASGTPQVAGFFDLDLAAPTTPSSLALSSISTSTLVLSWSTSSDSHFDAYEIWYGTNQSDVLSQSGTALVWDTDDDALLTTDSTSETTVSRLSLGETYYLFVCAIDIYTFEACSGTISAVTLVEEPEAPSVTASSTSSTVLTVSFGSDANPSSTTYAIYNETNATYVDTNGESSGSSVFQTKALWGSSVIVRALLPNQGYSFSVIARNIEGVLSSTSTLASATTSAAFPGEDFSEESPSDRTGGNRGVSRDVYDPRRGTKSGQSPEGRKSADVICPVSQQRPYTHPQTRAVYYVTADCTKRPFVNPTTYFTYFTSWDAVVETTETILASIADDTLGFMPLGPLYDPASGTLIKTPSDPEVYLLLNGKRYLIKDESAAEFQFGVAWASWIEDVDVRLIENTPLSRMVLDTTIRPDGTILKYADDRKTYQLNNLELRWIPSEEIFTTLGFRWDRIVTIPDAEIYPEGPDLAL